MEDKLFSVKGQVVLASGASRGIGRALAEGFAGRGAQVVIAGEPGAADTEALADAAYSVSQPNRLMQYAPPGRSLPSLHPAQGKGMVDGRAAAYVCRDQTCSLPILAPEELRAALREA